MVAIGSGSVFTQPVLLQCYQYYYVDAALRSARRRLRLHNGAQRFGDVARFDQREPLRRADLILALLWDDTRFKAKTMHLRPTSPMAVTWLPMGLSR